MSAIAVVLSLVAVGLSAWAAFRPAPKPSDAAVFTSSQRADAKAVICNAAALVRTGISVNTNLANPGGDGDLTGALAVQANARAALSDGGQYLLARLDPATPTDVADAVEKLANTLLDIGAASTAGTTNADPAQAARLTDADAQNAQVSALCK